MQHSELYGILALLGNFASLFSEPSAKNFMMLFRGWVLCVGQRTISRVIQFGGLGNEQRRHHSVFYRFFSRATWDIDELHQKIFELVLRVLPEDCDILLTIDDTLCRKSGAHIWGGGMHHDPVLSNYGRGSKRVTFFSFGHSWVILCICIPRPWNKKKGFAIPIACRLYRSKKYAPQGQYKKRTELAGQLLKKVTAWMPAHRKVILIADTEYACQTVVKGLPERVVFVGPVNMDAALYDEPKPSQGRGRRRKKGQRLLSPNQLIRAADVPWKKHTFVLYGRPVEVLIKSQSCLWYRVAGQRRCRVIVTRDPKGRIEDRAYFSTDAEMTVETVAYVFSHRWAQEEMHYNAKQYLGLQDPQNGWWRRPKGQRKNNKVPGPQPHTTRGEKAATRTAPFILVVYALVVLWYLGNGSFNDDVGRVRRRAPWYKHKKTPSFGDMLSALRRHLWDEQNLSEPCVYGGSAKKTEVMEELLCAA